MSIDDAKAFLARAERDATLREELNALTGPGLLKQLSVIGARHGCVFTEAEYRQAVVDLADGELSEEALAEVLRELKMDQDAR